MTLVVDSGFVVAALVDSGAVGTWADRLLGSDDLAAPHLMPIEVANVLRRSMLAGQISTDTAALAHADLLRLRVELFAYEPFAQRVWELRENVSAYDASCLALAEALGCTLLTADARLARAPALRHAAQRHAGARGPEPGPAREDPRLPVAEGVPRGLPSPHRVGAGPLRSRRAEVRRGSDLQRCA